MFIRLLLLFILVAAAELAILVWLAQQTGFLVTVLIILSTGILGAALTRWQGWRAWNAIRGDVAAGRMPAASVIDGVMILVAGAFLLTPGLLSDTCGFLLLLPPVRAVLRRPLLAYVAKRLGAFKARAGGFAQGEVIDAEFRRADAKPIEDRTHQ
ncbi:MAG: FxsA family protein [Planctomycetaceae bacterium]